MRHEIVLPVFCCYATLDMIACTSIPCPPLTSIWMIIWPDRNFCHYFCCCSLFSIACFQCIFSLAFSCDPDRSWYNERVKLFTRKSNIRLSERMIRGLSNQRSQSICCAPHVSSPNNTLYTETHVSSLLLLSMWKFLPRLSFSSLSSSQNAECLLHGIVICLFNALFSYANDCRRSGDLSLRRPAKREDREKWRWKSHQMG